MRSFVILLAGLLLVGASGAAAHHAAGATSASTPNSIAPGADTMIVQVSGGAIDSAFRSLTASHSAADFARDLPTGDFARYQFVVLSRREAGPPEFHARWADVVFVRSGRATLRTGTTLAGRIDKGDGEASGSGIPSARERAVAPGDVLLIPAGLAHQWRPIGATPFSYVVLKTHPEPPPSSARRR